MKEQQYDVQMFRDGVVITFAGVGEIDLMLTLPVLIKTLVNMDASIGITKCPASDETEQGNP